MAPDLASAHYTPTDTRSSHGFHEAEISILPVSYHGSRAAVASRTADSFTIRPGISHCTTSQPCSKCRHTASRLQAPHGIWPIGLIEHLWTL